jgi:transcriptional regulator with XRE-family HTH domain
MDKRIADTVRRARQASGLSQAQLGAQIGAPQSFVAKVEAGADVRLSTLLRILEALRVTLDLRADTERLFADPPPGSALAEVRDFGADLNQLYSTYTMTPQERLLFAEANSAGIEAILS